MVHPVSQLFPNGRWLLCRPDDYDVRYKINPWMDPSIVPEKQVAVKQWENLHHHLLRLGAWIDYVTHEDGLPDMVFTANAGLVRGRDVVISRFRHQERQGEEPFFKAWFAAAGFTVHELSGVAFEGEGDALFVGDTLVGGCGFRSDEAAYPLVASLLGISAYVTVQLVDPRFYHLDTCFCPLNKDLVMLYPGAFAPESLRKLEQLGDVIAVTERDAAQFVCNAVVLGKDVVLPAGCKATYTQLEARGFTPHPVALSEFIKAGGAAKCLSLRIS